LKSEIVDDDHGFWKKDPLRANFQKNYSERIHHVTEPRLVCKFREIWLTGIGKVVRCLPDKKQNFRKVSRYRF